MGNDKFIFKIWFKCTDSNEEYQEEIIAEDPEQAVNLLYEIVSDIKIIKHIKRTKRWEPINDS